MSNAYYYHPQHYYAPRRSYTGYQILGLVIFGAVIGAVILGWLTSGKAPAAAPVVFITAPAQAAPIVQAAPAAAPIVQAAPAAAPTVVRVVHVHKALPKAQKKATRAHTHNLRCVCH